MNEDILGAYDNNYDLYKTFATKLEHLIIEILEDKNINYHSVTSRVKTRDSFCNKLDKSTDKYKCFSDITDVAGARIITYFEDDVDRVANIIEHEFVIDKHNSIDKRLLLDPDRFGYLSLHHVVSLLPERCALTEYKRFPNLKAEIQTRSILQHAWAEIEHDLGYKSKQGIPRTIRRKFSRLAGLLELADKEFIEIRDDLRKYEEEVESQIERDPSLVTIDNVSLISFVKTNPLVRKLDLQIEVVCGAQIEDEILNVDTHVERLYYFNITTISELERILAQHMDEVVEFARKWLTAYKFKLFAHGISIFYLEYVLLAKLRKADEIAEYLERYDIGSSDGRLKLTDKIIKTYNSL
jgi:ppGpp synthetase/RelA/SpoT-type nucleotidyltranferase